MTKKPDIRWAIQFPSGYLSRIHEMRKTAIYDYVSLFIPTRTWPWLKRRYKVKCVKVIITPYEVKK